MNEPFFAGHFPHRPVMPGVLMLEALARRRRCSSTTSTRTGLPRSVTCFAGIDGARFKRPVEPGDQLTMHAELLRAKSRIYKFRTSAHVGDELAVEAELMHHARRELNGPGAVLPPSIRLRSSIRARSLPTRCRSGVHADRAAGDPGRGHPSVGPHCVIEGWTTIGRDNRIFQFCSLGGMPQDKKYAGELTQLHIGDRNTIREFCTFNIGTAQDVGVDPDRRRQLIWAANVHIAHDAQVGSQTVLANYAALAGHVHPATGPSSAASPASTSSSRWGRTR